MVTVSENMIEKISNLSSEQFFIFSALLDEFTVEKKQTKDTSRRIGVAKDIDFPANFDEIDYGTNELFGLNL